MKALVVAAILGLATTSGCAHDGAAHSDYAGRSYAGDADHGRQVFETNCATCHGTGGRSGGVGPSLIDENERQDLARTIVWIENPDAPMPKLYPSPLTEHDVEDVAAFVQTIR